jgi:hypothetical protein
MFVDKYGEAVEPPPAPIIMTPARIKRFHDTQIVKFRKLGMSFRDIAKVMRMSHSQVMRRYDEIPDDVRRHYAKQDGPGF